MEAYTDSLRTLGRRLNAELLLNDTEADNSMRHAQTIGDAVGRMAGMINNLLVYFRLDSGKESPSGCSRRLFLPPSSYCSFLTSPSIVK